MRNIQRMRAVTRLNNPTARPTPTSIDVVIEQRVYQYADQACNASGCSGWTNARNTTTVTRTEPPIVCASVRPGVEPDYGCQ